MEEKNVDKAKEPEEYDVRVAGRRLESLDGRRKTQAKRRERYVKEEDPLYFKPDWENDLVKRRFCFDECEGADYSSTVQGYQFFVKDGETVMIPRRIAKSVNDNCKIWKRDKVQRDPRIPSRWLKSKTKYKRRCHFERVDED